MDNLVMKSTRCSIENLNTRTERHGEDKALAYDLSVTMTIPFLMLTEIFEGDTAGLEDFLWAENGGLFFNRIRSIGLMHEFEDHGMVIKVEKEKDEIWPVKIGKMSISPLDDKKVILKMQVKFRPEETDYPLLHRALIRDAWIEIKKPKQMSITDVGEEDKVDVA